MAPIIPAGGRKMDWVRDPEQAIDKKAQSILDDDPQLSAIKDLPGMSDGIAELQGMATEMDAAPVEAPVGEVPAMGDVPPAGDVPPVDVPPVDAAPAAPAAGGAVEQAVKKVEDAARGVADAAIADAQKAVTDAIKNVGKPEAAPVSDKLDEIKPDGDHEAKETPAEEAKEEHEKSETPAEEKKEEECKDKPSIPGVEGEKEGKAKKEGDKDEKKDDKPAFAASLAGMKRLADLSAEDLSQLRQYWKNDLGFPAEYVDAMLKKYTA